MIDRKVIQKEIKGIVKHMDRIEAEIKANTHLDDVQVKGMEVNFTEAFREEMIVNSLGELGNNVLEIIELVKQLVLSKVMKEMEEKNGKDSKNTKRV